MNTNLNYTQVFCFFSIDPEIQTEFCKVYINQNKHFILYKVMAGTSLNCHYVNENKSINPLQLLYIISESVDSTSFENIPNLPEESINQIMTFQKIVNWLYGFVPLQEMKEHPYPTHIVFSEEWFSNIYGHKTKDKFSLILSSSQRVIHDVIDFNHNYFQGRFLTADGYWTSKYYSNNTTALLTQNPMNLVQYFEGNNPIEHFSLVVSTEINTITLAKVLNLIYSNNIEKINLLYDSIDELFFHCHVLCVYSSLYFHLNSKIERSPHTFTVTFVIDEETDTTKFLQLCSNIENQVRKVLPPDISDDILSLFAVNHEITELEFNRLFSIHCPLKIEMLEAFLTQFILFEKLSNKFDYISCL